MSFKFDQTGSLPPIPSKNGADKQSWTADLLITNSTALKVRCPSQHQRCTN